MAAFESCCCCSLRAGSAFIGILGLIVSICGGALCLLLVTSNDLAGVIQKLYNTYYQLENPIITYSANGTREGPRDLGLSDPTLMYIEWGLLTILIFMFVASVVNSLLIIGSIRETLWMMLPWMVVQWITILLTVALFAVILWHELIAMPRYWWAVMFMVAVIILMMLAFVMVLSQYQAIREREAPEFYQGAELVHRHIWLSQKGKYFD